MPTSWASPPDRLRSHIDHVALAVGDLDTVGHRWHDELGGRVVGWSDGSPGYRSRQLRFRGGGKLELIAPVTRGDGGFVDRFLDRFGQRIHHVTIKVDDLHEAISALTSAGLDVVDVQDADPTWQEAFLRPSQVGGLIVQVASTPHTDDEWAFSLGHTPEPPPVDAAILHGPLLSHPDLDAARRLWNLLGADVDGDDARLSCRWDACPLDVIIEGGRVAGPVALRFSGVPPAAADFTAARSTARDRRGPGEREERRT